MRRQRIDVVSRVGMLASALILGALLPGCRQDMMKATPFSSGEYSRVEGPAEGRVNLWPLFYHRAPATSFLWPIGEATDTSWAIRPLVAAYDDKLDLLWPFIHVDSREERGHLFPLAWWGPNWFFLFPLVYHDADTTLVLPLFGIGGNEANRWFWTPLCGSGGDTAENRSWFYSPAYLTSTRRSKGFGMVPPILSWWNRDSESGAWDAQLFLSIAGMRRESGRSGEHLLPFYWRDREEDPGRSSSDFLMLLPAYAGSSSSDTKFDESVHVLPALLSGWARTVSKADGSPAASTTVLGPFYVADRDAAGSSVAVPALLSWAYTRPERGTDWHLLLSTVAWGGGERDSFSRVIPFYYSSGTEERGSFGLPFLLYFSSWDPSRSRRSVVPFVSWTERSEDSDLWFLLGLARAQSSPQAESHYVFPFYTWSWTRCTQPKLEVQASVVVGAGGAAGTAVAGAGPAGDVPAEAVGNPTAKGGSGEHANTIGAEVAAEVPTEPITSEEERFRLVYLLYDTLDRTSSDGSSYHRTRVLWRLWHDESTAESRALDVFPFFTYDRKGDDSLSWSWLYTFLRYERKGEEASLNLFFLPAIPL